LVEIELTDKIEVSDQEFQQYIPVLYDISYNLMFRLYEKHRVHTPTGEKTPKGNLLDLCPEIDITEYLPNEREVED